MKIALVYDRVNKWGGAERVLLTLHELFPQAPLYTSVYNSSRAPWADVFEIKTSFLQQFPFASSFHEYYATLMPQAFERFSFDEYDIVISVSSEAAKGIITKKGTFHLCYCLTPTRYLWSGYKDYFPDSFLHMVSKPVVRYLREWDTIASQRPDRYIAISQEVKKRIKTYYNKESIVIYPPVDLKQAYTKFSISSDSYFLVVSRLVSYKRIDLAIKACNILHMRLKIIGTGSEEKNLRQIAGPTIEFLGNLTDEQLVEYYKGSSAVIFPGIEDFGLVPVEAQSLGKPVIAFYGGGSLETIIEGKTGTFFYQQRVSALVESLKTFHLKKFKSRDCIHQAERFNKQKFKKEFMKIINFL